MILVGDLSNRSFAKTEASRFVEGCLVDIFVESLREDGGIINQEGIGANPYDRAFKRLWLVES